MKTRQSIRCQHCLVDGLRKGREFGRGGREKDNASTSGEIFEKLKEEGETKN